MIVGDVDVNVGEFVTVADARIKGAASVRVAVGVDVLLLRGTNVFGNSVEAAAGLQAAARRSTILKAKGSKRRTKLMLVISHLDL
jgi:hypothetical protein